MLPQARCSYSAKIYMTQLFDSNQIFNGNNCCYYHYFLRLHCTKIWNFISFMNSIDRKRKMKILFQFDFSYTYIFLFLHFFLGKQNIWYRRRKRNNCHIGKRRSLEKKMNWEENYAEWTRILKYQFFIYFYSFLLFEEEREKNLTYQVVNGAPHVKKNILNFGKLKEMWSEKKKPDESKWNLRKS